VRRHPRHQQPVLTAALALAVALATAGCAGGATGAAGSPEALEAAEGTGATGGGGATTTAAQPTASAPSGSSPPAAAGPAGAAGSAGPLPGSTVVLAGPVDVDHAVELDLDLDPDEPTVTYVEVALPDGVVAISCPLGGTAGTVTVALDRDGRLSLSQDVGAGPEVVSADTVPERDRPAVGDPVLLSLLCGEGGTGGTVVALSLDALPIQLVELEGEGAGGPHPLVVTSDPATQIRRAFVVPARQVLGTG
jgi:hypothetical protein